MKAASITLAALPTFQAAARPLEPDFSCYMRTSVRRILDLPPAMYGVEQSTFSQNGSLTTGNAFSQADYVPPVAVHDLNDDPRYHSAHTEIRGGVTRTLSGSAGADLSDDRDCTLVINPGINATGATCVLASDRASRGDHCRGRAASQRAGGR